MSRLEQAPVPHARPSLTYAGLLALPGARRAFGAAAVARLSFGMAGLSLLLLIHQATGSFAAAGAAGGAFSAGTLTAPVKARLLDRRGQRATLPLLGLGAAAALLAMALLGQAGDRNPAPYIAACAVAGALMPPVGAAMRARWAIITGGGRNLERAYSLDAATEETLFTAGPLLTGVAVTAAGRCCRCWSPRRCWRPGACCWRAPGPPPRRGNRAGAARPDRWPCRASASCSRSC